jgi:alpha-galactosidase/6-phospho-beta-glucosidase family protein
VLNFVLNGALSAIEFDDGLVGGQAGWSKELESTLKDRTPLPSLSLLLFDVEQQILNISATMTEKKRRVQIRK